MGIVIDYSWVGNQLQCSLYATDQIFHCCNRLLVIDHQGIIYSPGCVPPSHFAIFFLSLPFQTLSLLSKLIPSLSLAFISNFLIQIHTNYTLCPSYNVNLSSKFLFLSSKTNPKKGRFAVDRYHQGTWIFLLPLSINM